MCKYNAKHVCCHSPPHAEHLHTPYHTTPDEHTVYRARPHHTNTSPHRDMKPSFDKMNNPTRLYAKENKSAIQEGCMLACCFFTTTKLRVPPHKSQHLGSCRQRLGSCRQLTLGVWMPINTRGATTSSGVWPPGTYEFSV